MISATAQRIQFVSFFLAPSGVRSKKKGLNVYFDSSGATPFRSRPTEGRGGIVINNFIVAYISKEINDFKTLTFQNQAFDGI